MFIFIVSRDWRNIYLNNLESFKAKLLRDGFNLDKDRFFIVAANKRYLGYEKINGQFSVFYLICPQILMPVFMAIASVIFFIRAIGKKPDICYATTPFFVLSFWPCKYFLGLPLFCNYVSSVSDIIKQKGGTKRILTAKAVGICEFLGAKMADVLMGHAASAYYCSGFDAALVVTIDGQGDGLSHTAWAVKSGEWQKIAQGGSEESLGAFYAAITEGLGFKPNRHEGKIVGLAAFSDGKLRNKLEPLVVISQDKMRFKRQGRKEMIAKVQQWKGQGYSREDIADYGQNLLEEMAIPHIQALVEKTGLKKLALVGGVFANVKLNQRVVEQCAVEEIFVQPAMGDEGIVLGSALHYYWQGQIKRGKKYQPAVLKNVYFGNGCASDELEALIKEVKDDYKVERVENLEQRAARLVADGQLVGWFDGRMEFGPRALGSRSILGDPRNKKINDILNERLRRSEFMPFAPSVLAEYANEIFEKTEAAFHAAEFMTITFNVKPAWQEKISAIVHIDGTCRPQLVKKEINPRYWQVIDEFRRITGVPLVLNTSFNIHEEPIVATLYDGLRSLKQGAVDYVAIGRYLITNN